MDEPIQSDMLEDEVAGECCRHFELNAEGNWLGLEARVLTWERLRVAAVADLGY
jgi:hypothetical protein